MMHFTQSFINYGRNRILNENQLLGIEYRYVYSTPFILFFFIPFIIYLDFSSQITGT